MPAGSTAFSSFEVQPRSQGINGSLTPARRHRHQPYQSSSCSSQRNTNDIHPTSTANTGDHAPLRQGQGVRVSDTFTDAAGDRVGGGGISLQETEARIHQLESSEFDLKMRLFYTEERLGEAAGGTDAVELHREVANAKRVSVYTAPAPSRNHACFPVFTSPQYCGTSYLLLPRERFRGGSTCRIAFSSFPAGFVHLYVCRDRRTAWCRFGTRYNRRTKMLPRFQLGKNRMEPWTKLRDGPIGASVA